ncbi:type VI secretion system tube protein Hcp [Vibrio brasiliensis]|nr:type VI secretion system tube protein Hcp [Vibrio brasiliensis]
MPLLYNALSSGEKMKTVELKWYRTSIEGKQENFFTTKLASLLCR